MLVKNKFKTAPISKILADESLVTHCLFALYCTKICQNQDIKYCIANKNRRLIRSVFSKTKFNTPEYFASACAMYTIDLLCNNLTNIDMIALNSSLSCDVEITHYRKIANEITTYDDNETPLPYKFRKHEPADIAMLIDMIQEVRGYSLINDLKFDMDYPIIQGETFHEVICKVSKVPEAILYLRKLYG